MLRSNLRPNRRRRKTAGNKGVGNTNLTVIIEKKFSSVAVQVKCNRNSSEIKFLIFANKLRVAARLVSDKWNIVEI